MIPPIIKGLIVYLSPILATDLGLETFNVWDGETPRWDLAGNPVGPANVQGSWPAVDLEYQEPGFSRNHTFTNAVDDEGMIKVQVWATTREQCEQVMNFVEGAFEKQVSVIQTVDIGGPAGNPNFVISLLLKTYGCFVDKNYRTAQSQLLYRGDMYFKCDVHTNAPTRS